MKKTSRKHQKADKENISEEISRIYVGNINPTASIELLKAYFTKFGTVVHAFFFRYFPNCNNAFVDFKDKSSVEKVLGQRHFVFGRNLTVGKAKNRNNSSFKETLSYKAKITDSKVLRYRPY